MKKHIPLIRLFTFLLAISLLSSCWTTASAEPGILQNGWLNYSYGGHINIPQVFSSDGCRDNVNGYAYDFTYYQQKMFLTTEERNVSEYSQPSKIIDSSYSFLLRTLPEAVYNDKSDNEFTLSGFSGNQIYYIQYTLDHDTLYTIRFEYPTANRKVCDPYVERICDSFSTTGYRTDPVTKPSPVDLDMINADIKYPNYDWMYLDSYKKAVVSHDKAVYCFKDPDNDIWRNGNYFTVKRGTELTILAESEGYACVILTGTRKAGWINMDYLRITGNGQGNSGNIYNPDSFSGGSDPITMPWDWGNGREVYVPANPQSAFGIAFKETMQGIFYSDRDKANIVTATYYDRKDAEGNRRSWYTSSYYDDPNTGYRINYYYADGILFFADAYVPGERSAVTFYFWGDEMFACHDLRVSDSVLSFRGDFDFNSILSEFGNIYQYTS